MSGDETVLLQDDTSGRISAYVRTLAGLPVEPSWVLVGGLAVNVCLGRVHRATNDIDTVTHDQPRLVELLVSGDAIRLSAAKVQFHDPDVEVDVMESTEGDDLPAGQSDRVFALVRRWTMRSASNVALGAVDPGGKIVAMANLRVASRSALVALKTVAMTRRRDGKYREKVGSDMQDLYRLAEGSGFAETTKGFESSDAESRRWVSDTLLKTFSPETSDLRYSLARLRRYANNVDARSIDEQDLSILAGLGAALAVKN